MQNIILACRALGLGTLITTNHIRYEDEVKALLGWVRLWIALRRAA
jgi:nitroreductase